MNFFEEVKIIAAQDSLLELDPDLPHAQHLRNVLSALKVARVELENLRAHVRSSHEEIVCSQTDNHSNDGNDVIPMLTCLTQAARRS